MKCEKKTKILLIIIILILFVLGYMIYYSYKNSQKYETSKINKYNESFCNLVNYMNSVESLLAKSTISKNNIYSAEVLSQVWRDANLAIVYLNQIPVNSENISETEKFLNQVSDYSYNLYIKSIEKNEITEDDLKKLSLLHQYCTQYETLLNELSEEIFSGEIEWSDLYSENNLEYAQAVDNITVISNLDSNLNEYEGLIYDGAYSDHVNKLEKVGLIGSEISEEEAYNKVLDFFGIDNVKQISFNNLLENGDIQCYDFSVELNNEDSEVNISVTKIGGFVLELQNNRDVENEKISHNEANEIGKEFLSSKGFDGMEPTYFTKNSNIVTINYAYEYDGIIVYPDLIKVKIALDNGEILGMETDGYLNSHTDRVFESINISIDEAREKINSNLEILSEGMAVIPTEWKTEILCYEFKGKVNNREFLVYINAQTGKEEEILVILDTPGGILTI